MERVAPAARGGVAEGKLAALRSHAQHDATAPGSPSKPRPSPKEEFVSPRTPKGSRAPSLAPSGSWQMGVLVLFNTLSTAMFTIVYKVAQDVYGNDNASFFVLSTSVCQFSLATLVFVLFSWKGVSCVSWRSGSSASASGGGGGGGVLALTSGPAYAPVPQQPPPSTQSAGQLSGGGDSSSGAAPLHDKAGHVAGQRGASEWSYLRSVVTISACCAGPNFVWAVTGVQVKSSLQGLMGLLLVPCTFVLTVLVLKRTLPLWCAVGALLVVLGALVGVASSVIDGTGDPMAGTDASAITLGLVYFLYAAAHLPYAFQYIVTEQVFSGKEDGLWALEVSTGWLQVAFLLCLAPLQASLLSFLGEEPTPFRFWGGVDCFLGRDPACRRSHAEPGGELHPAWWPAFVHVAATVISITNDVAYLLLTKHGSAVLMTVAQGFSASVVAVAVTHPSMGAYRENPSALIFFGCVVSTVGMVAWVVGEREQEREEAAAAKAEARSEAREAAESSHANLFHNGHGGFVGHGGHAGHGGHGGGHHSAADGFASPRLSSSKQGRHVELTAPKNHTGTTIPEVARLLAFGFESASEQSLVEAQAASKDIYI